MRFVQLRISGSAFRWWPRRRSGGGKKVQLELESRTISALGPAGVHTEQLKAWNFTWKKPWWRDSFHFAIQHFQRTGKKRTTALFGKEKLGRDTQGPTTDTSLRLFTNCWFQEAPSLSFRDVWFPRQLCQTCFTKPTLHAYTYVHAPCACATSPDRHTQAGTHKHTVPMAKKLPGAFFKQGYSSLLVEPDLRTGAGHLGCKSS